MNAHVSQATYAPDRIRAKKEGGPPKGSSLCAQAPCAGTTTLPPAVYTAVRRAMAGLAAGFGMVPGDPRLRGRARARRWAAQAPRGAP